VKKICTILLIIVCNVSYGQRIPIDKQEHFAAGAVLGAFAASHPDVKYPFLTSVLVSATVGFAKEFYDRSQVGGKLDRGDIAFTVAGGAVVGSVVYVIKRKKEKRRSRLRTRWMYQQYFRY
jgi:uncharacterized protein YfiM (DUF2279 family)